MKAAVVLSMMLSLSMQSLVFAQGFNQAIDQNQQAVSNDPYYKQIYQLVTEPTDLRTAKAGNQMDFSTTSVRGGVNSGKPLGMYSVGSGVVYRSGYAKLKPEDWAEWTCALRAFLTKNGGGWDSYQQALMNGAGRTTRYNFGSQEQEPDPLDKSFVPYAKQEEFAKSWWSRKSPEFRKMGFMWKDWWINDAILDGNLLIGREHIRNGGSAEGVAYEDATLAKLLKKE